ncbi:Glioma tumor suppressor candidate region protein 2 [Boothiomyces macroporosus]|uniref:Ribosome biogenesis protein NOP53 n=1 Tax=Boothiomyces macroporosus TaxID=261099 RepID=A0AAD5Y3C4_9FUNG|nr:Glioma tumor suppressor candidate region protein 2 [Boothiomyces macroporosus]
MVVTKKPQRKGKKEWRKNVDITDVEEQLHELRNEEMLGFLLINMNKTLKIDEIIQSKSAIPEVLSRKSLKKTTAVVDTGIKKREISKTIKLKIEREAAKKKAAGLGPGASQKARKDALQKKREIVKKAKGGFDLWAEEEKEENDDDYLEPIKAKPAKKPKVEYSRPSAIPAVKLAHPGVSYNPTEEDHKNAILIAAEVEFKKIEQQEQIEKGLSYPPELDDLEDETFFDEDDEEEEDEPEEADIEESNEKPKKTVNTRADINRKKRVKEQLAKEKQIKEQKNLIKSINKIKELEKELALEETEKGRKRQIRAEIKKLQEETAPRKVSRHKFKDVSMEIQLPDEMADSLYKLKPEGNLIKDRFKSLEARNLIEPRVPVKRKRKYKIKEVESHDYKRFK